MDAGLPTAIVSINEIFNFDIFHHNCRIVSIREHATLDFDGKRNFSISTFQKLLNPILVQINETLTGKIMKSKRNV